MLDVDIFAPGFTDVLAKELHGAQRPVVIAEGVVGYFDTAQRIALLERVRHALPAAGTFLADLRVKEGQAAATRLLRLGIWVATRGRGASASFTSEAEVRDMLQRAGFRDVAQLPTRERDVLSGVWRARP